MRTFRLLPSLIAGAAIVLGLSLPASAAYLYAGNGTSGDHDDHSHTVLWAEWGRTASERWKLRLWDSHSSEYALEQPWPGALLADLGPCAGDYSGDWDGVGDGEYMMYLSCAVPENTAVTCYFRFVYDLTNNYSLTSGTFNRTSRNHHVWGFWDWQEVE